MVWAAYVRVSRVGAREETLISPDLQRRQIEGWAKANGHRLVLLEPELDASGGDNSRPILAGAIEQVERGEIDGIAVAKFDRLSRSLAGSVEMLRRIEAAGGQVRSAQEQLDATTAAGRTTRNILFSIAEGEREHKAEEFERSKADAIRRGVYISGHVPLGYRKNPERRLEPSPDAPAVRWAFRARAEGESWRAVADGLSERLGRSFYGPTVARMVRNPAYLGVARQGEHVNAEAHEALVDRATWEAAQTDYPRPPRGTHGPALLGGIIRCAGCQWRMTSTIKRGAREYRCRRRGAMGVCPAPAIIVASLVEPYVEGAVLAHVESGRIEATRRTGGLSDAEGILAEADAELAAYQEAVKVAEVGVEHFQRGMHARVEAVEEARRALAAARLAAPPLPDASTVRAVWAELSVEERNHLLRRSLGAVWVRRGRGPGRIRIVTVKPPGLSVQGRPAPPVSLVWEADLEGEIGPALAHDLGEPEGEAPS